MTLRIDAGLPTLTSQYIHVSVVDIKFIYQREVGISDSGQTDL